MSSLNPQPAAPVHTPAESSLLDRLVSNLQNRPGAVLTILERLQEADPYNHLPADTVQQVARRLNLPLSQLYSVATFYSFFNLRPQGKHSLAICRGTACHTRGSRQLLETVLATLQFTPDETLSTDRPCMTTTDNLLTVRTVACFGQCALAPVVEIDRHIYGHMNRQKLLARIESLLAKEKEKSRP